MIAVPEGFRKIQAPGGRSWILRQGIPLVPDAERWDTWLAGKDGDVLTPEGGRSPARLLSLPGIGGAVVRRCLHGGFFASVTRDLFPGVRRSLRELEVSERLRRRGVATPEILALYSRRSFPGLYRSCVLSRLVPESDNLRQWLRRKGRAFEEMRAVMLQVARAVSALHAAGCFHRDLNLSNLLVAPTGIWILDLDGARVEDSLKIGERGANLMRLYRSFSKESGTMEPLSSRERALFLRHYVARDRALLRGLSSWLALRWPREKARRAISRKRILDG